MMKTKPVKTIDDLRRHQDLLRMKLDKHEADLNNSWVYLKTNYKQLVWKEINPFKGNKILNVALDMLQPGLLPIISEVAKGSAKGSPVNTKVIGSSLKFVVASLGIKWLKKWLDLKQEKAEGETPERGNEQ